MTWYFEAHERQIDVWDHNGNHVAQNVDFSGVWSGDFPNEVYRVMRESMDGTQPSLYNQHLLADAATDNIKEGTPPGVTGPGTGPASAEARPARGENANETTDNE